MIITKIIFIIGILTSYNCLANRVRRVIHGWRIVGREGPYDVIKYAVAIGTVHGTSWRTLGFYIPRYRFDGIYGTIWCGGAILTPSVVQTACHCLASFFDDGSGRQQLAHVNLVWESQRVVYIGVNDRFGKPSSMMTTSPVVSEQFIIHEKCRKIIPQDRPNAKYQTYDYGFIKTNNIWIFGASDVPTRLVTFAPLYTVTELKRIFNEFQRTQPVCLSVGWGDTDGKGTDSDYIRGGWALMMSRVDCVGYTCRSKYGAAEMSDLDVKRYKTWVCAEKFPKFNEPHSYGDSGSPVTCNNAFFGTVQGQRSITLTAGGTVIFEKQILQYSAIRHTEYEDSANYRRAFDRAMREYRGGSYAEHIKSLVRMWGDAFVEHVGEEAVERAVDEDTALRRESISRKYSSPSSKSTSIARLMSQERAVHSFAHSSRISSVLLVFSPITLQFLLTAHY